MSTTTQILFNSPALHSLKRDQLVKLCKIHSIKATGKNGDLIVKLQQHARTLPNSAPLSVAFRSEDSNHKIQDGRDEDPEQPESDGSDWRPQMPRPSEQWDVMESIQEMEESSSQGTLSSLKTVVTGEFGTGSSKATSVSSSIKALATSLGLKRNVPKLSASTAVSTVSSQSSSSRVAPSAAQDELTRHAIPYASLPASNPDTMPQTDHFTFSTPDTSMTAQSSTHDTSSDAPIPGHALRPGLPAPSNARLSTGGHAGNTTTIRLVTAAYAPRHGQPSTPQLRPFETTFDLMAGSPFNPGKTNVWPEDAERLYPALPDLGVPTHTARPDDSEQDAPMPGALAFSMYAPEIAPTTPSAIPNDIFSPGPRGTANTNPTTPLRPPTQPFIFGSPLPQHNLTNTQFRSAAVSVLDEMNKRLAGEGVTGVGMDILDFSKKTRGLDLGGDIGLNRKVTAGERFNRMHEQEFEKMDSIANHYAAKRDSPERPKKRKSSVIDGPGGKRRPSGVRPSGTRVISHGARRKMAIPGGFGAEEAEAEEEGSRRESKRPKVTGEADGHIESKGKRVSIAPPSPRERDGSPDDQTPESENDEKRKQKERDAIRRKLELNKARRRSSMGRVSVGGGKAPLIPNQKAKGTRFGFLSSAKSMMQSVWNRGTSKAAPSNIPVSKPTAKVSTESKMGPPLLKKAPPARAPARPSSAVPKNVSSLGSVASTSSRLLKAAAFSSNDKGTISSNRSRSPIPSFSGPSSSKSGIGSVSSSRTGSSIGLTGSRAGSSRFSTRTSSIAAPSSIGTRSSSGIIRSGSRVSSLGTRGSLASVADAGSAGAKRAGIATAKSGATNGHDVGKKAASSRLMAPTASSLARTQSLSRPSALQEQTTGSKASLPAVVEVRPATPPKAHDIPAAALDQITNSLAGTGRSFQYQSPRPGGIFSRPLAGPSSIPTPVRNPGFAPARDTAERAAADAQSPAPAKPKAAAGRKPRISRSRVIARLASQREAGTSGTNAGPSSGKTRSSLGAAKRQSVGGGKSGRGAGASGVMMSARKRARQSEYARRRSRVAGGAMEVDI